MTAPQPPVSRGRPIDFTTGHPYLRNIIQWSQEVRLDLWQGSVADFKKTQMPWFSPGMFRTGSRMTANNCVGASVLGFDFDDARFTDTELGLILRGTEHLIYTTISHNPKLPYRKIRVVVPLSRPVSLSDHERLMAYYAHEFDKLGKGSLDESTLKAERKFYMPHSDSHITWVKKRKQPLNVDRLLLRIPRMPRVQMPEWSDMIRVIDGISINANQTGNYKTRKVQEVEDMIASLRPGNRTHTATRIGGKLSLDTFTDSEREHYLAEITARGVSAATMVNVRQMAYGEYGK